MLGGYQILDLRKIDLTIATEASDITDAYVLSQLLKLRDHIDKAYDFSKPLENQLKPVLIRFRDKKADEKLEGAIFGELSIANNYYSFRITARLSGVLVLTINVSFEEITNDYGNKEWIIDDATILLANETQTISGDLEITGELSVGDDATITGDLAVGDDATITGDASVGGDLSVTGSINGVANPSVKPIYYHPIFMNLGKSGAGLESVQLQLTCVIFDNNPTPYDLASFKNKIKGLMDDGATIQCNGMIVGDDGTTYDIFIIYKSSSVYKVAYRTSNGATSIDMDYYDVQNSFSDGVNKIN